MDLKTLLKKTNIYQYKKLSEDYARRKERVENSPRISASDKKGHLKPVYESENSIYGKVKQLEKTLSKCSVDTDYHNVFFYSLDEDILSYSSKQMIDNMPCDYSVIVHGSLNDLVNYSGNIEMEMMSKKTISIIEDYIDRVCKILVNVHNNDRVIESLQRMKTCEAIDLFEALQRILFYNQLFWQTGHCLNGLGRMDKILADYPINDETDQLISSFLRTLHDHYNYKSSALLGDIGQIIILGGVEQDGSYFYNEYTKIILKQIMLLNNPDPKVLLRVSRKTPDELLSLAVEALSVGNGSPLFSNDDVVIPALIEFGYESIDAYNYGVSACWEPLIIGNSLEQNNLANIEYGAVLAETILSDEFEKCSQFSELLSLYEKKLDEHISKVLHKVDNIRFAVDPLHSLLMPWINKDIAFGGAKYNNYGILSTGISSAVNSLLNLDKYVFCEKQYTLNYIKKIVVSDYAEKPEIREKFAINKDGFGSDSGNAIELTNSIINRTKMCLRTYKNVFGGTIKFGLSSPAYINCGKNVIATVDGRHAFDPFPTHISKDNNVMTDIINFAGKLEYKGQATNGNVVDIMTQKNIVESPKFISYLKSAIKTGIFQMQFNVLTYEQLLDAKDHPDRYPELIVRVWGFSAYFVDLPEEYQNVLIERARQSEGIA